MTEFQKKCKQNPSLLATLEGWELFKQLHSDMSEAKQRKEFQKQINELFFNQSR
jgi:tRNA 2-selenouridine synthase SelU